MLLQLSTYFKTQANKPAKAITKRWCSSPRPLTDTSLTLRRGDLGVCIPTPSQGFLCSVQSKNPWLIFFPSIENILFSHRLFSDYSFPFLCLSSSFPPPFSFGSTPLLCLIEKEQDSSLTEPGVAWLADIHGMPACNWRETEEEWMGGEGEGPGKRGRKGNSGWDVKTKQTNTPNQPINNKKNKHT